MSVAGALIGGGVKLLGGLFGSRSARKAEERAAAAFRRSGLDTRIAAESGGFNPLTFLQATGGGAAVNGGFAAAGQPAALASQELIMGGLQDFGRVLSGEAAQEARERELSYNLAKLEYEKSSASRVGEAAGSGFATARRAAAQIESEGQIVGYSGGAPPRRPGPDDETRIVVYAPDKSPMLVPAGIAERLNIKQWQNLEMGVYTELVGELRGEGEGALDMALEFLTGRDGVKKNMTGADALGGERLYPKPAKPPAGYMGMRAPTGAFNFGN